MRRFLLTCLLVLGLLTSHQKNVIALEKVSYTVTVTATVGEPKLTLFGYTSPNAQVQLLGIGVAKDTLANEDGYFFFDRVFLPQPSLRWVSPYKIALAYPELYLLTIDTDQHTSFPTSLPPLPTGPYNIAVGPILLPPTLTLEKGKFLPGEQVIASGQTIPYSQTTIALANEQQKEEYKNLFQLLQKLFTKALFLPSQTYAYSLPQYQINTGENGRFQFNLPANPSTDGLTWRVFAATRYLDSPSPKSNTLTFSVLTWWQLIWEILKAFLAKLLGLLKPFWWFFAILVELVVFASLLTRFTHKRSR